MLAYYELWEPIESEVLKSEEGVFPGVETLESERDSRGKGEQR